MSNIAISHDIHQDMPQISSWTEQGISSSFRKPKETKTLMINHLKAIMGN
jgi:hypothetical protein